MTLGPVMKAAFRAEFLVELLVCCQNKILPVGVDKRSLPELQSQSETYVEG